MKRSRKAMSFALSFALLAGALVYLPAEAAEQHDVLWLDSYDVLYSFSCGYAYVEKGDDRCLIDPSGARLEIDPAYECIGPFRNGLAPVRRAGQDDPLYHVQTIGWIGLDGELAIPLDYYGSADTSFQRNVLFSTRSDGRAVTLGTNGQEIAVAPATMHLTDLPWANLNGLVPVYVARPNGPATLGFADQNWELVIPARYQIAYYGFGQGGAMVSEHDSDDNWFINSQGEAIWGPFTTDDPEYLDLVSYGFCNGLLSVPGENGKWGAIDTYGELVIPCEYDQSFAFSSGLAFVVRDGVLQVIDTSGQVVLPQVDADIPNLFAPYYFCEGLARICRDGRWGYIDLTGREVIPCVYTDALLFSEGLAWVQREDGVWGVLKSPLAEKSAWAEDEIWDAYLHEIVTERTSSSFQDPLTRLQCAELMVNLTELVTGRPIFEAEADRFTDTIDWMPRKGAAAGLIEGMGDGTWFGPEEPITREQLAAMLCRAIRYIEGETGQTILPASADLAGYADVDQVSPWAADSMAALTAAGLLQGTSATTLSPKDTTTVEQGILLALRAWRTFAE